MKRYYLGLNAGGPKIRECLWGHGSAKTVRELSELLAKRYQGTPMLTKNGRSALAIALKSYFDGGDKIIIAGFTCYAVYDAVKEAGMTPVFADINKKDLNFDIDTLEGLIESSTGRGAKGIVIQNTLGNPVDIVKISSFAKKHGLTIIEDLAHSAGVKYFDGTEVGTVGAATALSFGKDKSINAITGGAVVLRAPIKHEIEAPFKNPRLSDVLRARFYPLFTGMSRGLNSIHLGGVIMKCFLAIRFVERSADSELDLKRRPPKFVTKIALKQIKDFHHRGQGVIRDFYLVKDRDEVLKKLRVAGYFFDSFWYEKPVSPSRYYKEVKFPEQKCPVAVEVSKEIINFPRYYSAKELEPALKIIKPYLIKEGE